MSDYSNFLEDAVLNHFFRNSSQSAVQPFAALFLLGSGNAFTVNTTTNVLEDTAHGLSAGAVVLLDTTGTLPGGLSKATKYYVVNPNANDFQVALTHGGAAIDITSAGSGTHSWYTGLDEAGSGMTEVSAGGYARQSVAFGAPSTVNDTRQVANTAEEAFTASADWGIIGAVGYYDASTSGNFLGWKPLTPQNVLNGNTFRFQIGTMTVAQN